MKCNYLLHPAALFLLLITILPVQAQQQNQAYLNYIDNYCNIAVIQQKEHRIPASITLAQGLLESNAGRSELAKKANNHFGIKCHEWTGKKVYYDDDHKNECFRSYKKVLDSYEDHSAFLKNRSRYSSLFLLNPTDYQSWAHGLKKAGYATDPSYAYKLISLIETYDLHRFDINASNETRKTSGYKGSSASSMGKIRASSHHEVLKNNGVKFVVANSGDTYESIASEFKIKPLKLRAYNEIPNNVPLTTGTVVYLGNKKKKAASDFPRHAVRVGESMYSISQQYAVKVERLYELNNMSYSDSAKTGQLLKLR